MKDLLGFRLLLSITQQHKAQLNFAVAHGA